MNVAVMTDSTSDLTPQAAQQLGVSVVPLYVNFRGQVLKDGLEITTRDIFEGVRSGAGMPSTSQPTPADFEAAYRAALETHDHVLVLTISSKLSGTLQSASLAGQTFPGRVTVFDTRLATGSAAMMAERAVRLFGEGASVADVVATLEEVRAEATIRFSVASLDFLRKNGRIGGAQALIGGLLNIKPILTVTEGRVEAAGRARGVQKALADMVAYLKEYQGQHGKVRAVYLFAETREAVEPLRRAGRDLGIEEFGKPTEIGAVIAAHVGPGTYGVCLEPVKV